MMMPARGIDLSKPWERFIAIKLQQLAVSRNEPWEGAELTYDDARGFEHGYCTAVRYGRPKRGGGALRFPLAHTGELGRLHVLASGAQYSVAKYAIAPG